MFFNLKTEAVCFLNETGNVDQIEKPGLFNLRQRVENTTSQELLKQGLTMK